MTSIIKKKKTQKIQQIKFRIYTFRKKKKKKTCSHVSKEKKKKKTELSPCLNKGKNETKKSPKIKKIYKNDQTPCVFALFAEPSFLSTLNSFRAPGDG